MSITNNGIGLNASIVHRFDFLTQQIIQRINYLPAYVFIIRNLMWNSVCSLFAHSNSGKINYEY